MPSQKICSSGASQIALLLTPGVIHISVVLEMPCGGAIIIEPRKDVVSKRVIYTSGNRASFPTNASSKALLKAEDKKSARPCACGPCSVIAGANARLGALGIRNCLTPADPYNAITLVKTEVIASSMICTLVAPVESA